MDKRVEVLDITLTNGLFMMLDNAASGEQMFGPPQTREHLERLREGTQALLLTLLGLACADDLDEDSREKLRELIRQARLYFKDALASGTFEEPA